MSVMWQKGKVSDDMTTTGFKLWLARGLRGNPAIKWVGSYTDDTPEARMLEIRLRDGSRFIVTMVKCE